MKILDAESHKNEGFCWKRMVSWIVGVLAAHFIFSGVLGFTLNQNSSTFQNAAKIDPLFEATFATMLIVALGIVVSGAMTMVASFIFSIQAIAEGARVKFFLRSLLITFCVLSTISLARSVRDLVRFSQGLCKITDLQLF